jgi:hypothetical protein
MNVFSMFGNIGLLMKAIKSDRSVDAMRLHRALLAYANNILRST